jgi:hypothetical protein
MDLYPNRRGQGHVASARPARTGITGRSSSLRTRVLAGSAPIYRPVGRFYRSNEPLLHRRVASVASVDPAARRNRTAPAALPRHHQPSREQPSHGRGPKARRPDAAAARAAAGAARPHGRDETRRASSVRCSKGSTGSGCTAVGCPAAGRAMTLRQSESPVLLVDYKALPV